MQIKKILCILLCLTILAVLLVGCGTNNSSGETGQPHNSTQNTTASPSVDITVGPATILPRLEKAYNDQDIYAIVECFDPEITQAFFGVAKLFGVEADAFKSILPFMSKVIGASGALDNSMWGTATLTALDYKIDSTTGTLTYNVNIVLSDGTTQNFDETIAVMLVENIWYISSSQPVNITALLGTTEIEPEPIPVSKDITEADVAGELISIEDNEKYGLINDSGKLIIEPFFAAIGEYTDNYCPVRYDTEGFSKCGLIDRMGNLVVDYSFDAISASSTDGYWAVCSQNKWGFINIDTGATIEFQYDECRKSSEGYWAVSTDGKWGFINPNTGTTIPCQYDECGEFWSEATPVKLNGYWGAVDKENNTVVSFMYEKMFRGLGSNNYAEDDEITVPLFEDGLIGVRVNNADGVIKSDGSYVVGLTNGNKLEYIADELIVIKKNESEKYLYNTDGQLLHKCFNVYGVLNNIAYIKSDGEVYTISPDGNIINFGENIKKILGISSDETVNISLSEEEISFPGWILVSVKVGTDSYKSQSTYYINLVNTAGDFLLPSWISGVTPMGGTGVQYQSDGNLLALYNGWTSTTSIIDRAGQQIAEIDGHFYVWNEYIATDRHPDGQGRNDYEGYTAFAIGTKEKLPYSQYYGNADNTAIIVNDGVFYGLYYKGELLGDGMNYTQITYDDRLECFNMELGATTKQIRIGQDGTINYIEQTE